MCTANGILINSSEKGPSISIVKSSCPSARSLSTDSLPPDTERTRPGDSLVTNDINLEINDVATNSGTAILISPTYLPGSNFPSSTRSRMLSKSAGNLKCSSRALGDGINSLPVLVKRGSSS